MRKICGLVDRWADGQTLIEILSSDITSKHSEEKLMICISISHDKVIT